MAKGKLFLSKSNEVPFGGFFILIEYFGRGRPEHEKDVERKYFADGDKSSLFLAMGIIKREFLAGNHVYLVINSADDHKDYGSEVLSKLIADDDLPPEA